MKKVLVIEDTNDVRMIIGETLNMYGFSTLLADDGFCGIELARKHLPDLIICDVNMPLLDGYETLTALREHESTATIPFIFLSGAAEKPNVRRGMELGADDYLTKPFKPSELLAAVNARLEKQADIQRQSEKKLDELRGNISLALPHELRTPLNGIMGLASILMEDYATLSPKEVLESSRFIHTSALRLHRLIENFLVYSQLELMAKDAKFLVQPNSNAFTQVSNVVPITAQQVAAKVSREADLVIDVAPQAIPVTSENLKKIVEEIVDNAFKFSAPGSRVDVKSGVADNVFQLKITDRGRGMKPEHIANVGPHVQFERNIYEQQGAGLGLIIAKRLAELQMGRLDIESVPDQQTTVTISFPLPV